ncbi:MAG: glycoside hydrolase family 2 protein [bacterium]|jgi:hypothetical protein
MKSLQHMFTLILVSGLGFCLNALSQEVPRPEHPMPQMERSEWLNLNGTWEFAETDDTENEEYLTLNQYPDSIVVPFVRESKLSGLERRGFVKNVWYRRTFTVPSEWETDRVRLHFNACDWKTRVWINGIFVGDHEGGYSHFAFDITDALKDGENTIIVHAFDDARSGLQPLGKQSNREESYGIFYTRTTGIWQTVWLEGVNDQFIKDFRVTSDIEYSRVFLQAEVEGLSDGLTVQAVVSAEGKTVAQAQVPASWRNNYITLRLDNRRLWSVEDPFLYDLKLLLKNGDEIVDEVNSYFGLREVNIEGAAILINGKPVFQRLVLDQGFYPDGIWTAPTDEALKGDIELAKSVGFNGARLHQKVFEPRFLYWADKLGYLVWGEYPSYGANYNNPAVNRPYIDEWTQIVKRDRNHPSIIGWCPFNETPEEAGELQNTIVRLTRELDPSRPVIDSSGWTHSLPDPEVMDAHDYNQNPESFKKRWENYFEHTPIPERYGVQQHRAIPFFISEFGGIGWFKDEDGESWGYGNQPETEEEFFTRFEGLVNAQLQNRRLFGYCYTQLTDIEQEKNGVFYYDRTPKFDAEKFHAIQTQTAAYEENPPVEVTPGEPADFVVLLGGAPDGMEENRWNYTTKQPAENWMNPDFDDSSWQEGIGGFGRKEGSSKFVGTEWNSSDIWLRRTFEYDGEEFEKALLVIHYDNATEIFVNGKSIWKQGRWNDRYEGFDITKPLKAALEEGRNTIAIHTHQDDGGQFIDAAILLQK